MNSVAVKKVLIGCVFALLVVVGFVALGRQLIPTQPGIQMSVRVSPLGTFKYDAFITLSNRANTTIRYIVHTPEVNLKEGWYVMQYGGFGGSQNIGGDSLAPGQTVEVRWMLRFQGDLRSSFKQNKSKANWRIPVSWCYEPTQVDYYRAVLKANWWSFRNGRGFVTISRTTAPLYLQRTDFVEINE